MTEPTWSLLLDQVGDPLDFTKDKLPRHVSGMRMVYCG